MLRVSQLHGFNARRSNSLWTPPLLGSTLLAWWPLDRLSGSNGDLISTLTDYTGNGNDGVQGSAVAQGTLAVAQQNGLNALRTDGVTSDLTYPIVGSMFTGLPAGSIFWVFKRDPPNPPLGAHTTGLWTFGTDANTDHWPYVDGTIIDGFGSTARHGYGIGTDFSNNYHILNVWSAANDYTCYIDGTLFFHDPTNTVAWTGFPQLIGRSFSGACLTGYSLEGLALDSVPNTTDRQFVEGYLAWKWALVGNLPVAHPYKTVPPVL